MEYSRGYKKKRGWSLDRGETRCWMCTGYEYGICNTYKITISDNRNSEHCSKFTKKPKPKEAIKPKSKTKTKPKTKTVVNNKKANIKAKTRASKRDPLNIYINPNDKLEQIVMNDPIINISRKKVKIEIVGGYSFETDTGYGVARLTYMNKSKLISKSYIGTDGDIMSANRTMLLIAIDALNMLKEPCDIELYSISSLGAFRKKKESNEYKLTGANKDLKLKAQEIVEAKKHIVTNHVITPSIKEILKQLATNLNK